VESNTIFITGGNKGIGRGLAEAFVKLGHRVITGARDGSGDIRIDVTNPEGIRAAAQEVIAKYPAVNFIVNNAGIQRAHNFSRPVEDAVIAEEINANLLGVIRVCAAFIPHLTTQPRATIVNISSGLAFVPLSIVPVYCATKAAVHSFTVSLRHQLKSTGIRVIELVPPYVDTELQQGRRRAGGPQPMPLAQFIDEAMAGLATGAEEVFVGEARRLSSVHGEEFKAVFARMNP
jgi:uncharacterized oxidoreductase